MVYIVGTKNSGVLQTAHTCEDMKYEALVIDADGTLVGRDGNISPANVAAVRQAAAAGTRICLSTGRIPRSCARLLAELGVDGTHIFCDGALVCDKDCREVLYREPLEPAVALELVQLAEDNKTYLELYADSQYFANTINSKTEAHKKLLGFSPVHVDLRELVELAGHIGVVKAEMVMLKGYPADYALLAEFREHFKGRLRFSVASSPVVPEVDFVNIISPRVSKGEALKHLAEVWHLELGSIAAIGDGDNDLPVFQLVGLSIAMGNATESAKRHAHHVTEPVNRDGLASAIRRWILPSAAGGCIA